ncbi:hypothetical protein CTEN210_08669 [Chaetoceros tenuissimus]|uniref:Uncharacterized protein n=1 Tax=Chaetoceros tenuissimus TaxID=426638 RepID=A0AAD3CU67_9STRA|nr:hypothetical protein CTEN210_08669 [Chaetoceros tenuissimus]
MSEVQGNAYLLMREKKIARNKQRLESLGLSKSVSEIQASPKKTSSSRTSVESNVEVHQSIATRRSSRLKNTSTDDAVKDTDMHLEEAMKSKPTKKRQRTEIDAPQNGINTLSTLPPKPIVQSEAKPGTTRATYVNLQSVLQGDFDFPVFIGRRLAATGKAAVIEHANFMCGNPPNISFNKYSGVCEFKNDCLFLWVNVNLPTADIKNDFIVDNGKAKMSWYGGSRMRPESPVIQKLISVGKRASQGKLPEDCGIVLWYRLYNSDKRVFEPYACLGRLGYENHEPNSQPIKFTWNLLDYDILQHANEPNGFNYFKEVLDKNL